jgi:hypothetical protein
MRYVSVDITPLRIVAGTGYPINHLLKICDQNGLPNLFMHLDLEREALPAYTSLKLCDTALNIDIRGGRFHGFLSSLKVTCM